MRYDEQAPLALYPIGRVSSPFVEKMDAPRQGCLAAGVHCTIEVFDDPRLLHALDGIECWSHLWVLFWFDRDPHFSPKVQPPRSDVRRGVLGSRSPHRPNPLGMTVGRFLERNGRSIVMDGLDLLDGTPVVDLKPYVPYADRIESATPGWLQDLSCASRYKLDWSELILRQIAFLEARGVVIREKLEQIFEAGPTAHPSRRIRRKGSRGLLAWKEYRVCFLVEGEQIQLVEIWSGYLEGQIDPTLLPIHAEYVREFGYHDSANWLA